MPDLNRAETSAGQVFERCLANAWPMTHWRDCHVVLAVSGGADSVALLRAMVQLKKAGGGAGRLFVAHFNHRLRGESDADAEWLAALCDRLGLAFMSGTADVQSLAQWQGDGCEAAARTARYEYLVKTAEQLGARFVVTAHTADDQVETVLHRVIRGTGLAGLAGIPARRALSSSVTLVRPLLTVRRAEVNGYLATISQDHRIDSTNQDCRFTRNRLRHELLPLLRDKFNSDVDTALTRLATQAAQAQEVLSGLASNLAAECVEFEYATSADETREPPTKSVCRVQIRCSRLITQPAILVREVLKISWRAASWPLQAMGFDEWQLLASLAICPDVSSSLNLPGNIVARRTGELLLLERPGLS